MFSLSPPVSRVLHNAVNVNLNQLIVRAEVSIHENGIVYESLI